MMGRRQSHQLYHRSRDGSEAGVFMLSRRLAALGALWATVERAATQGLSFLVVAVLARLLGPGDFGIVMLAATIVLFAQALIGETFEQVLIQRDRIETAHIWSTFWLLLVGGLVAGLALVLAADWLAVLFGQPSLAAILRGMSLLPVLTAVQAVPSALFKRDLDFRSLAVASIKGTVIGGIAGVSLAFAGVGPWSLVLNLLIQ